MTEDEPWQDPKSPQDARLTSLEERLRQAQMDEAARTGRTKRKPRTGHSQGMRILSVLISYPLGCALIGYAIGRFADLPVLWVAMLFVGFGLAMWEVWKISKQSPTEG